MLQANSTPRSRISRFRARVLFLPHTPVPFLYLSNVAAAIAISTTSQLRVSARSHEKWSAYIVAKYCRRAACKRVLSRKVDLWSIGRVGKYYSAVKLS